MNGASGEGAIVDRVRRLFAPEPARDGASGLEQRVVEQQAVELTALDAADGLLRVEPLAKGERVERPGRGPR